MKNDTPRSPVEGLRAQAGATIRVALLAMVLLGSGCASSGGPDGLAVRSASPEQRQAARSSGDPATLTDLETLDQLKAEFNAHSDVLQLILLLSPT